MFKKIIFLFLFSAVAIFSQVIGPRFTTDSLQIHLDITEAVTDTATFQIYNGGDSTLVLYDIKTSCECLTFSIGKTKLKERESTGLNVFLDSSNSNNDSKNEEYIYLKTNDDDNSDVVLTITY